jgi:transglutaminase-like putative cysteine protease
MRNSVFVRFSFLFLILASPALVSAQFQQPTDEELKMTAEPKAPGAAAIYLYREETSDDKLHFQTYYERIKVLTEKGKEQATIHIPYYRTDFKISDIKGRTIHADGTVIPLTAKPSDLMAIKVKDMQVNEMVITLPSAEVGSILEYRLQIHYEDNMVSSPTWKIQQPLFVRKAHYYFIPDTSGYLSNARGDVLSQLMYSVVGVPQDQVRHEISGRYVLDCSDVPAIPSDDWMPPLNTLKWKVSFYYTYAHSGKDFWDNESKLWAKNASRFTNPSKDLKQAVSQIVAPNDTDEQKAQKIYAAVQKLDNTNFSRTKSEAERKAEKLKPIKNAEDVWKQQSGSDDDMALLFVALGRAAGLKVWPMEVVDRSNAFFDPRYLSPGQLDDYIAVLELGGKDYFLDPGQKMCPYGILTWKHSLASGFRLGEKTATLASTPQGIYKNAVVQRSADLTVDPDGSVKGSIRYVMTGPEALQWRQLALQNDSEKVKKQFNESLRNDMPDGVEVDFDHFLALDDYESNLMAIVKVSGNIATATGKHFFLPGLFFQARAKHPFVAQDKRDVPVDVHYASMQQDEVTYHLPDGFAVESSPQTTTLTWPDHAMLKIASGTKGSTVTVARNFAHNYAILDAKEYADLHDYFQKVAAADQQQLVLTRTPAPPKGN